MAGVGDKGGPWFLTKGHRRMSQCLWEALPVCLSPRPDFLALIWPLRPCCGLRGLPPLSEACPAEGHVGWGERTGYIGQSFTNLSSFLHVQTREGDELLTALERAGVGV